MRDLGGLQAAGGTTKRGVLVRASCVGELSAAGRDAMRAHGIRTVIDLRGDDEVAELASPFRSGMAYERTPLPSLRTMALHDAALGGYLADELRRIAEPGGGIADPLRAIAEANPGIVLHCAAGRDRTGVIVALLLAAFGVRDKDVIADYVASDDELASEYARFKAENPERAAAVDEGIAKRAWVMAQVVATLRDEFGGAASFLRVAGVQSEHLDAIRAMLVA